MEIERINNTLERFIVVEAAWCVVLGQLHIQCLTSTGPEFWTLLLNCVALLIVLSSTPVAFHHLLP